MEGQGWCKSQIKVPGAGVPFWKLLLSKNLAEQEHSRLALWRRVGREDRRGDSPSTKAEWRMETAGDEGKARREVCGRRDWRDSRGAQSQSPH